MGKCCSKLCQMLCSESETEMGEDWIKLKRARDNNQLPDHVQHGFNVAVIIVSAFHFLVAIGIIIFGIYTYALRQEMNQGKTETSNDKFIQQLNLVPIYLICVGGVVAVASLLGVAGIMRHYIPLMVFYLIFLFVYSICQLICAILAVTLSVRLETTIYDYFSTSAIVRYRDDADLQSLIDFVQIVFECCGASDTNGYMDWNQNIYFRCADNNPSFERCGVPFSCCNKASSLSSEVPNLLCGYGALKIDAKHQKSLAIHTQGCIVAVFDSLKTYGGYIVAAICGLVLVPIVLEILLALLIRDVQEERDGVAEYYAALERGDKDALEIQRRADEREKLDFE